MIQIVNFTPMEGAIGGALIGISIFMMFLLFGKIAGISGIFNGTITFSSDYWKPVFLLGIIAGGVLLKFFYGGAFPPIERGWILMLVAGLLVGFGTKYGNGCTSGHGVCGLARLSKRSFVAVFTFLLFGMLTSYIFYHVLNQPLPKVK